MTIPSAPVDDYTASLLDLLADDAEDWYQFTTSLRFVANQCAGRVSPNDMRPHLRDVIAPQKIGPFYRRAVQEGLIKVDGWVVSDDTKGGNSGRPARCYRMTS